MQGCAPGAQPERVPAERPGGAVRAPGGGVGPKDLDSRVPPEEVGEEATHLGSEY